MFWGGVIMEIDKQSRTDKPVQKSLLKRIVISILIFLLVGFLAFQRDLIFQKLHDSIKPEPRILVTDAVGRNLIGEEYVPYDKPTYLVRINENLNYLIFEMKNDYNIIPEIFFVFDTDKYCEECYYFTTTFKNVGEIDAENIVYDLTTFTNKIQVFEPDRRIRYSDSFGKYGSGGITFTIDRLGANESASVSYRVDNPPKNSTSFTCLVDGKPICRVPFYGYNMFPAYGDLIIINESKIMSIKDLEEGFYKIDLKKGTVTPDPPARIITESKVIDFE